MLDFSFTEEQVIIQNRIREFAEKELLPRYQHHDQTETFPLEQLRKMAGLGVMGLRIPADYGGQLTDYVTAGLIIKELARGDPNCAYLGCHSAIAELIAEHACAELKEEWLPAVAKGEKLLALAVTEPHCGSDVAAIKTRAIKENGYYLLRGEKSATTFMMDCDALVVFAKTDPEAKARGVSSFLVPTRLPGIMRQSYKDMGGKCIRRGSAFLDDVRIPEKNLLGEENKGFYQVMGAFDVIRVLLCLIALGAAEKSLEETIEYAKSRTTFGQPLAKFESVSFSIAEHYTRIAAAHWLCFHALWLHDRGLKHARETAMCKYFAPLAAVQAIRDCLLLHGDAGYTKEFPFEQRLRDVIGLEIADGTAQIQKIVISRELMGREYLPY